MTKKYYITTAIAYTNGKPHMGHALEIVQADVLARYYRLIGQDVFFQTGTDEHGLKNWQTSQKEGLDIQVFLDKYANIFVDLYKKLNISYDNFIRTSDKQKHYPGAQKLWNKLLESGDIYKKQYKGLYCVGCESYKTEKELVDGKCIDHPTRDIQEIEEENYFFKLSKYKDKVIELIKSDTYKITPKSRKNEILAFLENAKDISFSRPKTKLPWGVTVPNDEEHVMYVWCDALSNYITGIGYGTNEDNFNSIWPADIHVVGKDILRFHAAFWPAMLLSANIPLPKELFVHGHILSEGTKMGKSTGNVIEPFTEIEKYGSDIFRYYVIDAMPFDKDGEYNKDLLKEKINNELVSNFSNFCYRTLSFIHKKYNGEIKDIDNNKVIEDITSKFKNVKEAYENHNLKKVIEEILSISQLGNQYFQSSEPWKEDNANADKVLGTCVNIIKNLSILLSPIIPDACNNIQKQLNLDSLNWNDLNFDLKNHKLGVSSILFKKIE